MTLAELNDVLYVKKIRCMVPITERLRSGLTCETRRQEDVEDLLLHFGACPVTKITVEQGAITAYLDRPEAGQADGTDQSLRWDVGRLWINEMGVRRSIRRQPPEEG